MLNLIRNTISNFRTSKATQDANNFLAATGITGATQSRAIYNLVNDLQASGLWSKMKAVYPMVTDNYNLLSYTEDFSNAAWNVFTGSSVSSNTVIAPNGTLTADTLTFSANNLSLLYQLYSSTSAQFTISVYAKSSTGKKFCFRNHDGTNEIRSSDFTTTNQWQRFSFTFTSVLTNVSICNEIAGIAGSIDIWGAQLQLGALSNYQPILTTPAAFMASQMKYNLKDARDLDAAFRLTWSGGWTYSATGATPNGTNAYADTKFSPSANLNINSSHLSIYSRTAIGNLPQSDMGSYTASATDALTIAIAYNNSCYMGSYAFNAAVNYIDFANTDSRGLYINTRTSATSLKGFKNNTIGDTSTTSVNGVLPSVNTIIGAESFNGVPISYSTKQYAFASLGNGLSDNDALLLNQIVEKYQVALSRGVQAAQSFYYNSAYSNEANTYLYSTQITGTTQVSAINTLINGLKANNLWAKMKAVYPFVTDKTLQADMAAQMKFNLVNPQDSDAAFRLAFSGGWTYSTNGAQPNGTNGYADTKLNLASIGISAASNHISVYLRTNSDGVYCDIGAYNIASDYQISTYAKISNVSYVDLGVQAANRITYANTDSTGYYLASRTASNILKAFKNNILKATNTNTNTASILSRNIYISANNDVSGVTQFSNRQNAFTSIGDGLSDAEAALLYQLIQQYQTDLSRQV